MDIIPFLKRLSEASGVSGYEIGVRRVVQAEFQRLADEVRTDALGNVIANGSTPQVYAYDAYGVPVGFTLANALTALLYSGEMTDQLTGLFNRRAWLQLLEAEEEGRALPFNWFTLVQGHYRLAFPDGSHAPLGGGWRFQRDTVRTGRPPMTPWSFPTPT